MKDRTFVELARINGVAFMEKCNVNEYAKHMSS